MKVLGLFVAILILAGSFAFADLYYESEMKMEMGGAGEGRERTTSTQTYISGEKMKTVTGDMIVIARFDKGLMWTVNNKNKTYIETTFEQINEQMKNLPVGAEGLGDVNVEKTADTEKINDYNCTKYLVSFAGITSEQWVTKDIKNYQEFKNINKKMAEVFGNNPLMGGGAALKQFEKIDGFPVKTVAGGGGGFKMTTSVTKIESSALPENEFELPEGYTKQALPAPPAA